VFVPSLEHRKKENETALLTRFLPPKVPKARSIHPKTINN
jgi:hypothetical protein